MSEVKAWREAQAPNKMSQERLAKLLGTTQPHVCQIEQNEGAVGIELAAKIFVVTGLRVGRMKDATDQQAQTVAQVARMG